MRSSRRSLVLVLIVGILMAGLAGALGMARLLADSAAPDAFGDPLILSGQKPRLQDFFPGSDATFTVAITNTGAISFQTVNVSGATTDDCNRDDLGPLAPGASLSYTCTAADVDESFLNVLQVNGGTGATTVSHQSNAFVKVLKSELRLTKNPTSQTVRRGATAFFTVTLFNPSPDPDAIVTIVEVDDTLADDCDLSPTITINIPPGETIDYPCQHANVQEPMPTVATGRVTNPITTDEYTASDVAWVEILDLAATLTPQPTSLPELGGPVTFTVDLVNTGSVPIALTGLTTNQFGNILDSSNLAIEAATNTCLPQPSLPTLAPYGGSYRCTFIAAVSGQPSNFSVVLTATGRDNENHVLTATTNATVVITNLPASIDLTLGAEPPFINPPSRQVTFSVQVENTSESDVIRIIELEDEFLGSLDGRGTCDVPVAEVPPRFSYQCEFSAVVSGELGQQKSRTITVTAEDDDLTPETIVISEEVTVSITESPAQAIFMPSVTDDTVEPNNSCTRPYPLILNRQYFFLPPAVYPSDQDYYSFELAQSTRVRVELTNFVPRKGQLVVRKGEGCLMIVARNPDEALNKTLDLGTQEPGRYYIQIINDNKDLTNIQELYGLIVRTY